MSQVLDALIAHARAKPDATALSNGERSLTYPQLLRAVEAAMEGLRAATPANLAGAPVAVHLDNSMTWVVLDLALVGLGWPSLPIPGFFTASQSAHAIADCGAGLSISRTGEGFIVEVCGEPLRLAMLDPSVATLPEGTAKITYTSGSTGSPKGVCLSQAQMEAVAASLVEVIGADYAGLHLPILPLSILLENVAGLYTTLLAGGRYHVLAPSELGLANPFRPDLAQLVRRIAGEGANSLILVPELLRALLVFMGFSGARFPDLRLVAVGGAKVAPRLLEQAAALGLPVFEGYGLSECASVVALNTPRASKRGSVGKVLPHLSLGVDDTGEIVIGPRPFLGYAGGRNQWGPVRTGDLGALDADGFLSISGRRGNLIINAYGRNISPEWVESELTTQPEIRQAVVFGEAQPDLSALLVPLMPDMDPAVIAAAVERANAALPEYARVRRWRLLPGFDAEAGEVTGNGRPRRAVLQARHRDFLETADQRIPSP